MRIIYIRNLNQVAKTYGEELARRGHYIKLYEPNLLGNESSPPAKLLKMPGRIFSLRNIVRDLNPKSFDIAHIHWASYGVLGLLSSIPFIVHCHGNDVLSPSFRPILKPIFKRAAAVICITPDLLLPVQSIRPDAVFLPAPIDTDHFQPPKGNLMDLFHPWTVLLFTRLVPKKGLEISTQGIERFAQRHPEVRVQVVDWGSEKEKYKQCYGKRFEFVPYVAPTLVPHLIASANVVVGQFLAGAIGLSELQAMSCAKPVIASFQYKKAYATSPPLCQATTVEEVDAHLEYLYQHSEIEATLGRKGREWVIANHGHRMLAGKLEQLYQTVLVG